MFKAHKAKVIKLRPSGLQRFDGCNVFLPIVIDGRWRQVVRIFRMVLGIGIADFTALHVHLDNAETGIQVSIVAINGKTVNGLVVGHGFAVEC